MRGGEGRRTSGDKAALYRAVRDGFGPTRLCAAGPRESTPERPKAVGLSSAQRRRGQLGVWPSLGGPPGAPSGSGSGSKWAKFFAIWSVIEA